MLVDLEHGIPICVAMALQQRGGTQSLEDVILICVAMELQQSGGCQSEIWHLRFRVCFFCFFVWDKQLYFFIDERLMKVSLSKRTIRYFKELTLHVSIF